MATNDVRYYLNGMFFDHQDNKLVSTDGHRMFVGKPPTRFGYVLIETETGSADFYYKGNVVAILPCKVVDATYPDWRRLANNFTPSKIDEIGLTADYIGDALTVAKLFSKHHVCKFEFQGAAKAMRITYSADAFSLIMPARF
ncbi:hypothetical protein [Serratia fonticola]|uniref:hypothetical protein n=1 Tax=Serratia fonticola TaxID=47917 RepID=UPI00374DA332